MKDGRRATIHANPSKDPEVQADYSRPIELDEVVDGKAVRDWPDGVSDVLVMPDDPFLGPLS